MGKTQMRALICQKYGDPELLEIAELPRPEPGAGQVLIEVAVAGVSYVDTLIIRNLHQVKHELPFSPSCVCCSPLRRARARSR